MDLVDGLDNVHGHSRQSPVSPSTKSTEISQTGQCPSIQWTLSLDSVDSLDIVHGHPGQCPGNPGRLDNVHGQSPLSPWTDWTLSSLIWLKKLKLKWPPLKFIFISF